MWGRGVRLLAASTVIMGAVLLPATAAQAAGGVSFDATLNGRAAGSLSTNSPLVLHRGTTLRVDLTVHNASAAAVTVAAARVQGRVMGLSFFSFDTQINLPVPAGGSQRTSFDVSLTGLADQADGLLPTTVSLLNKNSDEIVSKDITVDVRGKLTSIYGLFGLAIAAITVLWLISLLYRVSRRALSPNRWQRAIQFSAAGFGVGLALTFSVSALRLLTPDAPVWAPFVFGAGAVGFALGYITPGPRIVDADEEDQFIAARERQYARVSGGSDEEYAAARTQPVGGDTGSAAPGPPPSFAGPSAGPAQDAQPTGPVETGSSEPGTAQGGEPRDATRQVPRAELDSIFGPEYGSDTGPERR